jgi:hypothetical protein
MRFFFALQAIDWDRPRWFISIRRATRQEDHDGIDAIALIDTGEIAVQIKSSWTGLFDHQARHGTREVVLVVGPSHSPETIRRKTMQLLFVRRGQMLRQKQARR